MDSKTQAQSHNNKIDKPVSSNSFEDMAVDFAPIIHDDDMLLRGGQDGYTPNQVLKMQRVLGNQTTLQLMRKADPKPRDFSRLKMIQREGGLPPPPDYDDDQSQDNSNNDNPPQFMSTQTGQDFGSSLLNNPLPTPESSIKELRDVSENKDFAVRVLSAYGKHIQANPNDTTFTQYWSDYDIERVSDGWMNLDTKAKKSNQYAMTELIKEEPRLETAVSAKQFEESDESVGKVLEGVETGVNLTAVTAAGFNAAEGVKLAVQLKDGVGAVNTAAGVFEATVGSILSIAWLPLIIGYEIVRAFKYNKVRRDGYKERMDALEGKQTTEEDVKLYDIAKYAYKKTKRAFNYNIVKIALKIVRMIALVITLLTGGTSAIVTASIAAIAAALETTGLLYRKAKGFIKLLSGSRGKNRQKNAEELVKLAKGGNVDAAQTIIDVDPFDNATMKAMRAIGNKLGSMLIDSTINPVTNSRQIMQGLEKPGSAQDLVHMLQYSPQEGGWTVEHETMLSRALANTMVSQ